MEDEELHVYFYRCVCPDIMCIHIPILGVTVYKNEIHNLNYDGTLIITPTRSINFSNLFLE